MRTRYWMCAALIAGFTLSAHAGGDRHQFVGALDTSYLFVSSPLQSWLQFGYGKLRFDEQHDGLQFSRAFLDYRGRLTPTLTARVTVDINDDLPEEIDLTEAFLEFRPVPRSPWRFRGRLGAFYPRISLENVGPGWSSIYTLNASAINTWIGEELRTVGAELGVSHPVFGMESGHRLSVEAAAFFANDPAGALLAWKGWSVHDRQTGLQGILPLSPLPIIQPGSPGHTVLVLDLARSEDGRMMALLGQSYMPAQNFQVLRPRRDQPWFELRPPNQVATPFWPPFAWDELARWEGSK